MSRILTDNAVKLLIWKPIAEEDGIPVNALITRALEGYLGERQELVSELASIEEDYTSLGDEKLLTLCLERLSKLKIPLSRVIAEDRDRSCVKANRTVSG